jgi:hypothetical protein
MYSKPGIKTGPPAAKPMHGNVEASLEKAKIMAETLPEVWLRRAVDGVPLLL